MTEVILLERVENLGQMGDVVTVKPGYARNFLLPQGKALRSTKHNLAIFEAQRAQLEAQNLERKKEAEAVAGKMDDLSIVLVRAASEAGTLFGSVSARDVSDKLTEEGFTIHRTQVVLAAPIKTLGLFDVTVRLHPEVSVVVTANVARSQDEAELQAERGGAITEDMLRREADAEADAENAVAAAAALAAQADMLEGGEEALDLDTDEDAETTEDA
ncbi:MAG: 50S ribosomal protein L9 [Alphaproteobacteria bacterium]